jgi:pilus biogenesis lipoprotein CpaD
MIKKSIFAKAFVVSTSLSLLAACGQSVGQPGLNDQVMRNTVQLVRFSHIIKAEDDKTETLSEKTIADLNTFLHNTNVGYGDVLMVDGAYNASDNRLSEIQTLFRKRGYEYAGKTLLGAKPVEGDIVLYVERHVVTTPNCGNWPEDTTYNSENNRSVYNGCSTVANLGLMVANPRDLVSGQSSGTTTATAVNAVNTSANSGRRNTTRRR